MTDEQKTKRTETLELNRETVQDLTETEAEATPGGMLARTGEDCSVPLTRCVCIPLR